MKESKDKNNSDQDQRLAEFADQVMAGKSEQIDSRADDELRGLEETILCLKSAIPRAELDEATVKQMHARLNACLQRESAQIQMSFWQKWFGARQSRPQIAFIFAMLAILVLLIFIAPRLTNTGSSVSAVATTPSPFVFVVAVLAGAILLVIWINRHK